MTPDLITALAAFALVSSITPGPNNLMLMASGANFGLIRTLPHMLGVSLGFVVMAVALGAGLVQLFDAWPASYTVMKALSTIYLLYLAWKIASNRRPPDATRTGGRPMSFLQAAAFQWVNPKAVSMALTALTVYSPPTPTMGTIVVLAGVFGLINLPSIAIWVIMGQQMSRFLHTPRRLKIFNVTAGLLLVATLYPILMA
ncbi:MAG: LysE family translocator [Rhodobacteraceae bacterium]|nr:LysE family translocator [Paracoccaceae bacterium]